MENIIHVQDVSKKYGSTFALQNISFDIPAGRIVGLVGPNGAGKTTLLRAITGSINYEGVIKVLDFEPQSGRHKVMEHTGVIHDVAVLPPWMKVRDVLDYMVGVHPSFNRERCHELLADTDVTMKKKVKQLSKGMKTQLHLALVLATDTKLLILDEPTHGLDILFRKKLYTSVLQDYFDEGKSIFISTHQVEEVEHILSDVIFLREGKLLLSTSMDDLHSRFFQLVAKPEHNDEARKFNPLTENELFGRKVFIYRDVDKETLSKLGEVQVASVADVFVALMGGAS